ncbi:GNAT family N-acetyltransferase [Lapidilactobacillus achengensis]|uniref:GNAT family N-acetyltransferase n=1 Tax=Lapidilactobacillus achengensis TaxID=2486000 RepID=A0ABW1UQL8_9LACO|nr:GNAT family N-acetyltransferase [Lapidilactobacillus achengensis]
MTQTDLRQLTFRPGTLTDLPAIMAIIQGAQGVMAAQGIPQWQAGYPDQAVLTADLTQQAVWLAVTATGEIALTMTLLPGPDPNYQKIAGDWLTTGTDYLVIHRIAVSQQVAHHGIAAASFTFARKLAQQRGLVSLRIDTHAKNQAMRHLIAKMGYQACGQVWMADGAPRLAYELVLPAANPALDQGA